MLGRGGGFPRGEAGVVLIAKNGGEGAGRVQGHRGLLSKQEDHGEGRGNAGQEAGEVLGEAVR